MTKFIIFSTQRSGSTLVRTSLDSHPSIICAGEVFLPKYNQEYSFKTYCTTNRISSFRALLKRRKVVFEYLDQLYSDSAKGALGFKFMYSQSRSLPYLYPMVLDYVLQNKIRVIHFVRLNPIKTFVSQARAKASGIYHSSQAKSVASKVHLDKKTLIKQLDNIENEKRHWRQHLLAYDAIEICYEEFIKDKSNSSRKMLEFLSVDETIDLWSPLKKLSPNSLEDAIENYDELLPIILKSGYAKYLD